MTVLRTFASALGAFSLLWWAVPAAQAGPAAGGVVIADLDGDGDDDVLLRNVSAGELAYWLIEDGAIVGGGGLGGIPASYEIRGAGDINGDGIDDLVIYDSSTSDVYIWFVAFDGGAVTLSGGNTVGNSGGAKVVGVGSFGGDGTPDLLLQRADSTISTYYLDASGNFAGGGDFGTPGAGWEAIAAFDADGDGTSDILLRNTAIGEIGFWEIDGLGVTRGSGFGLAATFDVLRGTADFNNDDIDDIVLQDDSGNVFIWLMTADDVTPPTIAGSTNPGAAGNYEVVSFGLFNSDSDMDILLAEQAAPNVNIAAWFLNGGNTSGGGFIGAPPDTYSVTNIGP